MRKLFSLIAVAALTFTSLSAQDSLRVMSYNLRFGELASMQQIAEYISSKQPDVVALQECDWNTMRKRAPKQNGVKFVNELAHDTGMFGLYGKSIDYGGGYYGIGLLSRYPVIRSERVLLPYEEGTEQRSMLVAEILLPDGNTFTFICTHLEVSSSDARVKQVGFINKYVRKMAQPIFIAGDMNARPESIEITQGFGRWKNLTSNDFTYSSTNPKIKIDYIFSYPAEAVELVSTQVPQDTKLSDHLPVISDVIIKR